MKKIKNICKLSVSLVLALILITGVFPPIILADTPVLFVPASEDMRGLWVTSAYNLDWPTRQGLSAEEQKREIDTILERSVSQGINAVFVQVRPVSDALYESSIFPWSHLLTGTQGQAPVDGFDPLLYWVTRGHSLGIEVHAWINPYRVTFPNQIITDPNMLSENHPARLNPSLVIAYNNALFFDPGNPAARQLIFDGVRELIENYNIDGIHLDDYFYPSQNFPDHESFERYGNGMDLHDWRRENVNELIRGLQTIIRQTNPRVRFGVSPFAIWKNDTSDPLGSATRGMESFYQQYADTRLWVIEGLVDYIVPQIYWFTGFEIADYEVLVTWWEDVVRNTNVDLYIGLAVYREVENRPNWEGEIIRQLERNKVSDVVSGSIFFRAVHMNSAVGDNIAEFFGAQNLTPTPPVNTPSVTMDALIVAQPSADRSIVNAENFWFFGSAEPGVPVFVNGEEITDRTAEGFFSVFLPLVRGQNSFTFSQAGHEPITRVITNNAPAVSQPRTMERAMILNPSPATDEWARHGNFIELRATAPAGARVAAHVGQHVVQLTQTGTATSTASNILEATFTGSFLLEIDAPAENIVELSRVVYTMEWNGITYTATSTGVIRQLGVNAPFFAEIINDTAWAFPNATTTGGSGWLMTRGQIDRVARISGNWTRLASGMWVESANIVTRIDENLTPNEIPGSPFNQGFLSEGLYIPGENIDTIVWEAPVFPAVQAEFDGRELIFSLGLQQTAPPIFYNIEDTLFSEIRVGTHNNVPAYFMTLREGVHLEGFFVEYEGGQLRLNLRRRRSLTAGNYPFEGFVFVLDPGHGGNDTGAIGPMGLIKSESILVLLQANLLKTRLEALGAEVHLSRHGDYRVELGERVEFTRNIKPDMFISLHNNATAETTNATNIRGFTVWYRNPNSRPAATSFMESLYSVNPGTNRNLAPNNANFFVVRPPWQPGILLEASFMNNIHDFSWMINPRRQVDYAWGIVNALLAYYR